MKAIRVHEFGAPEVMRYEDAPDPKPGKDQVTVRIRAAGVNPVETYIRSGAYARKPDLPYTPGGDGAGEVLETGNSVASVKPGDRVYTSGSLSGTYAETALCLQSQVHPLPEKATFSQGAALGVPYGTAFRALFQKACAKSGETVLIHGGSGGVGTAAIQFAKDVGCRVIATAGTQKGLELVREQGADLALDHNAPGYRDELREQTRGRGVDVILEMLADKNLANDLSILALKGRIVVIGSRGEVEIDPRMIMTTEAIVTGMLLVHATEAELTSIHSAISSGLASGMLRPVIGREFPLHEAPAAHKAVMSKGAYGKIVLLP